MTAPEHAHSGNEQANEQPALAQRLTDAIRDAAHVCMECDECGDGQCEDLPIIATTVGGDSDSGPIVIAVEGQPEAFTDVCAAVVHEWIDQHPSCGCADADRTYAELEAHMRAELDAKDAESAQLRRNISAAHQHLNEIATERDAAIQRAEAVEAEIVRLREAEDQ